MAEGAKKKGKLRIGKVLLSLGKLVAPKAVNVIEEITTKVDQAETTGEKIIKLYEMPWTQKALDIDGDGDVDIQDLHALLKLKGKELRNRLIVIAVVTILGFLAVKYGLSF